MHTDELLTALEKSIDPETEDYLMNEWTGFYEGKSQADIFSPKRRKADAAKLELPDISINSALNSIDAMIAQQYTACYQSLVSGSGNILNVRSNYGVSIIPILFGAELFVMDERQNTLPASKPVSCDSIQIIIDGGIPNLTTSIAGKVFDAGECFKRIGEKYPKIGQYVYVYHPDTQGPFDICEILVGSRIFYMLHDEPDIIKQLLELITQTYIAYMKKWFSLFPPFSDYSVHWGMLQKGQIMLRDDSAMNLSPDMYLEFIRPYDQMIFDEFKGGAIHFCGRGDHYIQQMSEMNGLHAIAMSQPHLNNMDVIYENTIDKNIPLIGFDRHHAEKALFSGRNLRNNVHCF